MGNFFHPEKWVTRGRLKRHVGVALLGGEICFSRSYSRKCPLFSGAFYVFLPTYFEKVGTLENVGNFSPGFENVGNFFS